MPIFDVNVSLEGSFFPDVNKTVAQIRQDLNARGIQRALLFSARAARVDPLSGNRVLKTMLDSEPGMYGCLVAHLNRMDASLQSIRNLLGDPRFVGLALTSTQPNEPLPPLLADEALTAARRFRKPVFIFTPNTACVEIASRLAQSYTGNKFIFLGMGGADWRTAIAAAHQYTNVFLELSGALDRGKLPAAIAALGSHRILFGSGSPALDPIAALGLVEDSDLGASDRNRILNENAMKLFNVLDLEAVPETEEGAFG